MISDFVGPLKASQHLNRDGKQHGLCGYVFVSMPRTTKVYDHRDGFDPKGGPACAKCADEADRIQNGMR